METHFSPEQRSDPRLREVESILRRCIHCGMCNPACPTYALGGDERDSPRGRITLIKAMFESEAAGAGGEGRPRRGEGRAQTVAEAIRPHIDRCLTCLACATACPSGVDYGRLVDLARPHIEARARRPLGQRLARALIAAVLPHPRRLRVALLAAVLARPFRGLLRRLRLPELAAMIDQAPLSPFAARAPLRAAPPPPRKKRARAALFRGCVQPALHPEIHEATLRLLTSQGVEIALPETEDCCGGLDLQMGREEAAKAAARRNIDAWAQAHSEGRLDAIVIDAAGCGAMIRKYRALLADDPVYAARADAVSSLAMDVSEFLAVFQPGSPLGWTDIKVAYHPACALRHGQAVHDAPVQLLQQSGFTVLEIPGGDMCCGSAGAYSLLQPGLSRDLRARRLASIATVQPDCVATGNMGCIQQLSAPDGVPVVHTIELLDWAYGGPCPKSIRSLEHRMRRVDSLLPPASEATADEKGPTDRNRRKTGRGRRMQAGVDAR